MAQVCQPRQIQEIWLWRRRFHQERRAASGSNWRTRQVVPFTFSNFLPSTRFLLFFDHTSYVVLLRRILFTTQVIPVNSILLNVTHPCTCLYMSVLRLTSHCTENSALEGQAGTYGRWTRLRCWRVPNKVCATKADCGTCTDMRFLVFFSRFHGDRMKM